MSLNSANLMVAITNYVAGSSGATLRSLCLGGIYYQHSPKKCVDPYLTWVFRNNDTNKLDGFGTSTDLIRVQFTAVDSNVPSFARLVPVMNELETMFDGQKFTIAAPTTLTCFKRVLEIGPTSTGFNEWTYEAEFWAWLGRTI